MHIYDIKEIIIFHGGIVESGLDAVGKVFKRYKTVCIAFVKDIVYNSFDIVEIKLANRFYIGILVTLEIVDGRVLLEVNYVTVAAVAFSKVNKQAFIVLCIVVFDYIDLTCILACNNDRTAVVKEGDDKLVYFLLADGTDVRHNKYAYKVDSVCELVVVNSAIRNVELVKSVAPAHLAEGGFVALRVDKSAGSKS